MLMMRPGSDHDGMASGISSSGGETRDHEQRVTWDDVDVRRVDTEPLDERESTIVTGASILGIIAGGVLGSIAGLIAAVFPVITWWMGLMIGAICGGIAAAMIAARLELETLQDESLPPEVRREGEAGARAADQPR
jgi:hypothetical protein